MSRILVPAALVAAFLVSPPTHASITVENGWRASAISAAPGGAFIGGMDFLPNGNLALFDGTAIVEVDPTGAPVGTIHTPPGVVFGSFVAVAPSGTFLLFGESSNQTITKVPLDGSPTTLVTSVLFNYDLVFESDTVAYLTAATGVFGTTDIFRLDIPNGTLDQIALVDGPSGPLAFDAHGNLYFGEGSIQFPAPTGQQVVRRFSQAQVDNAIGVGHLTTLDSQVFLTGFTNPADIVFDADGDLFVSDSADGFVRQFDRNGVLKDTVGQEAAFVATTNLALRGDAVVGRFDAFQPETAGTLAVLSTDFFSFNDVAFVTPARPELSVTPGSPIPDGPVNVQLAGGPHSGMALFLLSGAALVAPETHLTVEGASLFFGVDLAAPLLPILVPLDAQGTFAAGATNGPSDHGAIVLQVIAVDAAGAPVGTSNPESVTLQ